MRTRVGKTKYYVVVHEQPSDLVDVVVRDVRAETGREVFRHRDLAHQVERTAAALACDLGHAPAFELGERCRLGDLERVPPGTHRRFLEVGCGLRSPRRIAVRREPHGSAHLHELAEDLAGVQAVRVGHRELHGEGSGSDLRPHVRAVGQTLVVQAHGLEVAPARRREQRDT